MSMVIEPFICLQESRVGTEDMEYSSTCKFCMRTRMSEYGSNLGNMQ